MEDYMFGFIFMELFCSIHMSAFVLMPLAEMRNPQMKTHTFIKYFIIRAIILFIGNFIFPMIAILDFLTIFVFAFIIFPIMHGLKEEKRFKKFRKFKKSYAKNRI